MAAGSVSTQAISRLRTVAHCSPEPLAAIVPATPDDNTWVVETGRPYTSAAAIVPAATTSAQAPWPYVMCDLPIFSPTVMTMRFQPTMVPSPSAIATATLTHNGMNLVASSISVLKALRLDLASGLSGAAFSLLTNRIASEARYMSLRTLATASAGTLASEP